jgi:hypothetical protein
MTNEAKPDKEKPGKELLDFVREDYRLKAEFLVKQFERLWTRFSFFIAFETALFAALGAALEWRARPAVVFFIGIGITASLLWAKTGAEDRQLVILYRGHVGQAFDRLKRLLPAVSDNFFDDYRYVGERVNTEGDRFSVTRLPMIAASLFTLVWVLLLGTVIVAPGYLERPATSEQQSPPRPETGSP